MVYAGGTDKRKARVVPGLDGSRKVGVFLDIKSSRRDGVLLVVAGSSVCRSRVDRQPNHVGSCRTYRGELLGVAPVMGAIQVCW